MSVIPKYKVENEVKHADIIILMQYFDDKNIRIVREISAFLRVERIRSFEVYGEI